jgi:hypothetical protein
MNEGLSDISNNDHFHHKRVGEKCQIDTSLKREGLKDLFDNGDIAFNNRFFYRFW